MEAREPTRPIRPPGTRPSVPAPRVLLAEDDDALRSMVASALLRDGFEVAEVCDGSEALEWLSPAVTARLSPRPRTRWSRLTSASSIRE